MKKKYLITLAIPASVFLLAINPNIVHGARTDMVDVSSYNGLMTVQNFTDMRNWYGLKSVTVKLTEGNFYKQPYAAADLQAAKSSGLYINGYYFCRYNSVQSAMNEAQYACNYAKQVGLPVTSVLAMDIEAPQQRNLYMNENAKCINAAFKVIEENGYRPDVYSMSSWGDVHIPWSKIKWIANYPTHVTKNRFIHGNGWQFSSTQHFKGSYGNFDVTQLYTNYYTGGQNKNAVISENNTANVKVNHGKQINQTKAMNTPIQKQNVKPANNNSNLTENYVQHGTFTPNTTLNVRTQPNTHANITGQYYAGESLTYDHVYIQNGLVWLRFQAYSGTRYICAGVLGGQSYGTRQTTIASYYVVQPGDTLSAIAHRFGVSINYIAMRNGINPNLIYAGQRLVI